MTIIYLKMAATKLMRLGIDAVCLSMNLTDYRISRKISKRCWSLETMVYSNKQTGRIRHFL